jgi:hypothetical protein
MTDGCVYVDVLMFGGGGMILSKLFLRGSNELLGRITGYHWNSFFEQCIFFYSCQDLNRRSDGYLSNIHRRN